MDKIFEIGNHLTLMVMCVYNQREVSVKFIVII